MTVRGRAIDLDTWYVARASIAADVAVTATTSATGNACVTTGPFTVENPGTFLVACYVPYLTVGTTNLDVELWDGSTFISSMSGHMAASIPRPGTELAIFTALAAGAHNLTVKAFVDAGTGHFGANNGATGNAPNAVLTVQPA